jgi:hypothetical protein
MSYFTFWAVGLYSIFKLTLLWRQTRKFSVVIKKTVLLIYPIMIALCLAAIQFYPGYFYSTQYSARVDRESSWSWATSWSMHEEEVMSQLIPEFCGTKFPRLPDVEIDSEQSSYWGKNHFKDNSDSVGVVAILLSLIGVINYRRKEAYFFSALALFTFIYALGATTPLFRLFYYLIPKVDSLRAPSMILFIFSFSISLLAGMGVQSVLRENNNKSALLQRITTVCISIFLSFLLILSVILTFFGKEALAVWAQLFFPEATASFISEGVSKLDLATLNLSDIQSGAWLAFLSSLVAASVIWVQTRKRTMAALLVILIYLPVIDGVRFNSRFVETVDPKTYFNPNSLAKLLQNESGEFRVLNLSKEVSKSHLAQFGIELVQAYHGNQLSWYDDLLGGPHFKNRSNPRFLNLVGAKYVVIPATANLRSDYFGARPARAVAFIGKDQVIQNNNAFPRVYLVNNYKVFHNQRQEVYEVINGNENLNEVAYLESLPEIPIPPDSLGSDSCWSIVKTTDSVVLGVKCTSNRLLVLMDNYYDSWHATADGKPIEILRAYSSFRAVTVPAGTKEVKFKYKSSRFETGKLLTTVTSLFLLGVFGFHTFRNFKKNHLSYRNSTPN